MGHRQFGQLGVGAQSELLHDVGAMGVDGADADMQLFGDIAVFHAVRKQSGDFELAFGKAGKRVVKRRLAMRVGHEQAGHRRAEIGFARQNRLDCEFKLGQVGVF